MKFIYLLTSTLAVCLLSGCGTKHERNKQTAETSAAAAHVKLQPIVMQTDNDTEEIVGTVRPKMRATLEAKVSGQILELPVSLGQEVKAGTLIARLNAPEINARLKSATAALDFARLEWKRVSGLFEQQAATRADYESAESRLHLAEAGLAEAKAMMGYVEITAPFAGRVTRKHADRGDLASPGKPLVDMEDASTLELEAFIPETLSAALQIGASVLVRPEAGENTITGKISEIAPASDPVSRTFIVKVALPESKGIRSGQFARLLVPVGERQIQRVPASAVIHRGQLDMVFTVQDQKARMHLVRTGRVAGNSAEILSGLPETGNVVVEGGAQLVDGQPVIVE